MNIKCFTENTWEVMKETIINKRMTLEPGAIFTILGTRHIGDVVTTDANKTSIKNYTNKINDVYLSIKSSPKNKGNFFDLTVVISEGGLKYLLQSCVILKYKQT